VSGGYTPIEITVAEAQAEPDRRLLPAPGDEGIACTVRDGDAFVGFSMHSRHRLLERGLAAGAVLTAEVREAIVFHRLRARLAAAPLEPPAITIAICSKDRPVWVARLLDSLVPLREQTPCEILLVDNAPSDDRTRDVVATRPGIRYVREPRAGLDFARNRAVAEATGRILAFLDDDVVADANYLRGLSRAWAENPDAGAITGLVMPYAVETEAQVLFELRGGFRRGFRPLRYGPKVFGDPLHPCGAGKFGAGAHMSFDLALIRRLGGFDEALDTGRPLPGGGDIDMFYRVLRAGRSLVYEPHTTVFHEHRRDLGALKRQYYTWGLGFFAFIAKTMRSDPDMRPAMRRIMIWWLSYQARLARNSITGAEATPLNMVVGEVWGGLKGVSGEYDRSRRRSAAICAAAR
jgi:GT2 family glycosyltransferase